MIYLYKIYVFRKDIVIMDNMENKDNELNTVPQTKATADVAEQEKPVSKTDKILREIWEWIYTIAIAFAIVFTIKAFLFDIVKVDGSSMFPTLVHGDRLIVTKLGYKPSAGDIVILDSTYKDREEYIQAKARSAGKDKFSIIEKIMLDIPDNLKKRFYVKRVIALPGQTVDIKNGRVYIDNEILEEEYYDGVTNTTDPSMVFPLVVDDGTVFVMGDNRPNSTDSRFSDLGLVPYDALLGKAQIRIWPLNEISLTR